MTIAHRLITVIDYDTMLVMGGGKLLEHGAPAALLDKEASVLRAMVRALGDAGEQAVLEKLGANGAVGRSCESPQLARLGRV